MVRWSGVVEITSPNDHNRRTRRCHAGRTPKLSLAQQGHAGMTRPPPFSSPLLVGFDTLEKKLERIAKAGDSYPPYNIERIAGKSGHDTIRITLAVAGFSDNELEVLVEESQLIVRGRQRDDDEGREFLHRGIASRQFQRVFMLADGMRVVAAALKNGLLAIDLDRPEPERLVKRISISSAD
jgi:HSP20 family molecular chaperone IbpA